MILLGESIYLRDYKEEDWQAVHVYAQSEDVTKFEAWGPNTEEQTKEFISLMISQQSQKPRHEFDFAIINKKNDLLVGGCGIRLDDSDTANIGYCVNPNYQGQGIATQSAEVLLNFAKNFLKLHKVYATCDSENIASYKVMEKIGMTHSNTFKGIRKFKNRIGDELRYEIILNNY